MRVLFVTNVPAPYRVDFFNELAKYCELTVCYERVSSRERDIAWRNEKERSFKEIFCVSKNVGTDKSVGFDLIRKVKLEKFDHLIICGYSSPSVMLLIAFCRLCNINYFIETDGGFAKKDKWGLKLLKRFLFCKARGIFTTCKELEQYFRDIGYKGSIYKYPLASFSNNEIYKTPASETEKSEFRKQLGIKEEKIVLTVGRFTYKNGYGKGYDTVLQAAKILNQNQIGWYIVGGAPTQEFLDMKENMGLDNVHYVDFMKTEVLKRYYRASDVFVLMTVGDVWGLVVNEAMSCGLPVITTDRCIAGLEMVDNGKNGFIIPVGEKDLLAQRINTIMSNDGIRYSFSQESIKKAEYFSIENMAQKHIDILRAL